MDHFVAIVTAKYYYYYWMLTLDKDTGVFSKWSWSYVYKPYIDSSYRMLTISHVSERFIFGYGNTFNDFTAAYVYGLFLFDTPTLKLKFVYTLAGWKKFYGFDIAELNSDAIYWVQDSKLYR